MKPNVYCILQLEKHTIYMTRADQGRNIDVENSNVG